MNSLREEIYKFILENFQASPEHLWLKYPNYAVFRHKDNQKWFGVIMDVPKEKLGIDGKGEIDILVTKCVPSLAGTLIGENGILPAYHMNKNNWITLLLDGTLPQETIYEMLNLSFQITSKKPQSKKKDS